MIFDNPIVLETLVSFLGKEELISLAVLNKTFYYFTRKSLVNLKPFKYYKMLFFTEPSQWKLSKFLSSSKKTKAIIRYFYYFRRPELKFLISLDIDYFKYFLTLAFSFSNNVEWLKKIFYSKVVANSHYKKKVLNALIAREDLELLKVFFKPGISFDFFLVKKLNVVSADFFTSFIDTYRIMNPEMILIILTRSERIDLFKLLYNKFEKKLVVFLDHLLSDQFYLNFLSNESIKELFDFLVKEKQVILNENCFLNYIFIQDDCEKYLKDFSFSQEVLIAKALVFERPIRNFIDQKKLLTKALLTERRKIYLSSKELSKELIKNELKPQRILEENLTQVVNDFFQEIFKQELESNEELRELLFKKKYIEYFCSRNKEILNKPLFSFIKQLYKENLDKVFMRLLRKKNNFIDLSRLYSLLEPKKDKKLLELLFQRALETSGDLEMKRFMKYFPDFSKSKVDQLLSKDFSYSLMTKILDKEKLLRIMLERKKELNYFLDYFEEREDFSIFHNRTEEEINLFLKELCHGRKNYELFLKVLFRLKIRLNEENLKLIVSSRNLFLLEKLKNHYDTEKYSFALKETLELLVIH
jgi:hypothetical protein